MIKPYYVNTNVIIEKIQPFILPDKSGKGTKIKAFQFSLSSPMIKTNKKVTEMQHYPFREKFLDKHPQQCIG